MVYAVLVFINIVFGTSYPLAKIVLAYFTPTEWIHVRLFFTALIFFAWQGRHLRKFAKNKLVWMIISALCGFSLNQMLFAEGISRTYPAHASIINVTIPLQVMILGRLFLGESLTPKKIIGFALSVVGVLILLKVDEIDYVFGSRVFVGDCLIALNAFVNAVYFILLKKHFSNESPLVVCAGLSLFGWMGVAVYDGLDFPYEKLIEAPWDVLLVLAYFVGIMSILSYTLNIWTVKRVDVSRATLFVYLQPLTAAVLGFLFFGDTLNLRFYLSALLICSGLLAGNISFKKRA